MRCPFIIFPIVIFIASCKPKPNDSSSNDRLNGDKNLISGYEPINNDSTINVVIEIPAGTIQKWEVEKPSGELVWKVENGEPRNVNYLGYPANYGMIPKTLLPKELGGDGDPLDVLVLGPQLERGEVVKVRIIGVLKLLDRGEQDDKLIAITESSTFSTIRSIDELENDYPGILEIIEIWFTNYKGYNNMKSLGFGSKEEAYKLLYHSIDFYNNVDHVKTP